jgi:hypothetical protein
MKKFHIILLVTLGFLLVPTVIFACGKHMKNFCKKETSQNQKGNCCEDGKHSGAGHKDCGGKCGHKSCGCAFVCFGGVAISESIEIKEVALNIIFQKKKFYHQENTISPGFNFLWLIPKISRN